MARQGSTRGGPDVRRPAVRAAPAIPRSSSLWAGAQVAVIPLLVHRRVLGLFFSPDDLVQLARARGILPQPPFFWRLLSLRGWDALAFGVFGTTAWIHHAIVLALHAVNSVMIVRWARRLGAAPPAAFLAGALFGASTLAMTTVSQVSTMSEILALALSLLALERMEWRGARGVLATVAAQAAALLAKESVALVPLAALVRGRHEPKPSGRPWAAVAAALGVAGIVWVYVYLALMRSPASLLRGEAYAFGPGLHVVTNLVTYARWSLDVFRWSPIAGASRPAEAISVLVTLALLAHAWRSGSRAARSGLALWLASLAMVLPLRHQLYEHYDYVGSAGYLLALAVAVTDAAAWPFRRSRGAPSAGRLAWGVALGLALLVSLRSEQVFAARWATRVPGIGLPFDSMLRKMEVAENCHRGLRGALAPGDRSLVILSPPGSGRVYSVRSGQRVERAPEGSPSYNLFAAVLFDGEAVRAMFPQLESVRLDEHLAAGDTAAVLAANRVDGSVVVFGRGPGAGLQLARFWLEAGLVDQARGIALETAMLHPGEAAAANEFAAALEPPGADR